MIEKLPFNDLMKQKRKAAGLTLDELGRRCSSDGVSPSYVHSIEKGQQPGFRMIECICRELGIDDADRDLYYYQHGRIAPDLQFTDYGWVRARLEEFRFRIRQ